jgi:hypothetical protein
VVVSAVGVGTVVTLRGPDERSTTVPSFEQFAEVRQQDVTP